MNEIAYFLIEKDRSLNEGRELVNKALELNREAPLRIEKAKKVVAGLTGN